ncbi:unnamed protein product (macronuclear) [Paramecium tetraurelia]|uniref:DUF4200 domain-containing protein n=1 Tax=Paramecium tetraurelia TaxID=5888 RepID=A0DWA7_PARTE|nr:uncharacterized protein GSPATT00020966001 [Paramecium tetraurelia]CAK87324.1 unnamed protein product [Paramecium tetraurelia]|eukprot:XP_001454721.1 hypothetical protein (macronuclear) [Paramecium tetraurelia strain d4-2]
MQEQYELYYTTYNQERERIRKFYSSLKSEESNRLLKSQSLNESLKKAEGYKNEKKLQIKQKAHKFNIKAKIIQRKNNQMQEHQFLGIIKQKNELFKKEIELEHRLNILNAEQKEQIRQNQIYKSMKHKIYLEKVEQHQLKIEQEHQQMLEQMNNKFQKVEQYIQITRDSQKQKFRSLSYKYLTYKHKAENLILEKTENTFQEALDNMSKREQIYVFILIQVKKEKYLETKEKERKKIVRRNKLELVKFKRNKKRQESIEKAQKQLQEQERQRRILNNSTSIPKIIITEHDDQGNNDVEVEVYEVPQSHEQTQTYEEKVTSSKKNQKEEQSIFTNINESSMQVTLPETKNIESPNYKKPRRESEKERQYQILMKLRLNLKQEREKLDRELNSFFISQPINLN